MGGDDHHRMRLWPESHSSTAGLEGWSLPYSADLGPAAPAAEAGWVQLVTWTPVAGEDDGGGDDEDGVRGHGHVLEPGVESLGEVGS